LERYYKPYRASIIKKSNLMQVRGRGDIDLIIHARLKVLGNKPLGHRKSVRTIEIFIAALKKVRYAQCPMPNAQCPMSNAQFLMHVGYLMLLTKAIRQLLLIIFYKFIFSIKYDNLFLSELEKL
jgi:hypothetical protein